MTAAQLLGDLERLGISLRAEGDVLQFRPKSLVTPELLNGLVTCKAEILMILRAGAGPRLPPPPRCRCGSSTFRDVAIHGGRSTRRDCDRCSRFLDFPIWYGKDTRHKGQYLQ